MSDALIKSLLEILLLIGVAASGYVVRWFTSRGNILASNTKNQTALAEAKTDITMQTDRQITAARDYFVQKTADVEKKNEKLEEKVEAYRAENISLVGKSENLQGQVNVLLADQTASKKLVADHILMIGQQTAEITLLRAQLSESSTSYRKEIDDLKAEVKDLRKQLETVTAALTASNAAGERLKAERDQAVDRLAAQTPAAPVQTAPAGATP